MSRQVWKLERENGSILAVCLGSSGYVERPLGAGIMLERLLMI